VSTRGLLRLAVGVLAGGAFVLALTASAATNTVPPSVLGLSQVPLTIAQLTPPECAGMNLTSIVYNGNGGGGNDLVLGTAASQTLRGRGGDDCIVGGAGVDILRGDGGNDVLIGGPGATVVLDGGAGYDRCYRNGALSATPINCEEYYP
jgi:Ca2+-binding RTX toxin-like protein